MNKKIFMLIIVSTFSISQIAFADSAFPDVDEDHPYKSAIEYLKENAVISGYPDGTFKPGKTVNRAELLKIFIEGSGYEAPEVTEGCFSDVPADKWFSKYVCFAKQKGWVKGYADGKFRPEQTVNKVEALKMMGEIQDWQVAEVNSTKFQDADYSDWYGSYLMYAETKGLIPEADSGTFFSPGAEMSRAAIAENIFRAVAVNQLQKSEFSEEAETELLTQKLLKLSELVPLQIVINEMQYGYDTYGWVELYNAGSKDVDITDWSLTNGEAQKFATFPEITMPPGSYLVVYLDHGINDLYLEDGSGNYYLNMTNGLFAYQQDAIGLFNSQNISSDSMIDFMAYCNDGACSKGIIYQMAVNSKNWIDEDYVEALISSEYTQTIGRNMYSSDSGAARDWNYHGGINASEATPGTKNFTNDIGEDDFDEIMTIPYNEETDTFFNLESDSDNLASIGFISKDDCDYTQLMKDALNMIKDSCGMEDLSAGAQGINPDDVAPKEGSKEKKFDLTDNITVHLGKNDSHKKGRTHPQETIDGKVNIQINLNEIDCDPEKMKAVLFHELVHERQLRETGNGVWGADGKRQEPASKNTRNGTNAVDPLTMIADCMEVETHLLTARCLQQELLLPDFAPYKKSIQEMLDKSKALGEQYYKTGPTKEGTDPLRKGCFEYLDDIKNDTVKKNGEKVKIKNPQWLEENKKIREAYVNGWIEKMQSLLSTWYEKYFEPDGGASEKDKNRARAKFKAFLEKWLWIPKEEIDKYYIKAIEEWQKIKASWEEKAGQHDEGGSGEGEETPIEELPEWEIPEVDDLLVPRENENPSAFISPASPSCKTGEIIYLSGEESYDSDGYIEEFNWYLNGDILYSTNISTGLECLNAGSTISLELRIMDDYGAIGSKNISITVEQPESEPAPTDNDQPAENQPPVASIYPAAPTCSSGDTLEIYASESYDPNGTITNWEWYQGSMLYSTGQSMQYDCMMPGTTKKMELRLTDDDGITTTKSFNILTN